MQIADPVSARAVHRLPDRPAGPCGDRPLPRLLQTATRPSCVELCAILAETHNEDLVYDDHEVIDIAHGAICYP